MSTQPPQPTRMGPLEWVLLVALSVLWGGSFFFVGIAVGGLPPLTIAALRVGLAALALHALVAGLGLRIPAEPRVWATFLAMGFLNNAVPFSLIAWGQTHIASGLAAILIATTPVFSVLAAHWLTRDEKMSGGRVAGVVLGLAGVTVVIGPDALQGLGRDLLAQLAILGAALCYVFSGIIGRRFHRMGVAPVLSATGQLTASSAMLVPVALAVDRPWTLAPPGAPVLGAVAGLALGSTALAYILYFRILARAGATNVLLVTLLVPVSAVVLGVTFLDERLFPTHLAGMALIALGLAAIDGRPLAAARRRLAGTSGTCRDGAPTGSSRRFPD